MKHELKIRQCFLMRILDGSKTFEIRKNDRDFQVGDKIKFLPLECEYNNVYEKEKPLPEFKINYVLSGVMGLTDGYVGLSISRTTTTI